MAQASHLQKLMSSDYSDSGHAPHLVNLAQSIVYNLENEHNWTSVRIHFSSPLHPAQPLPRPLISGLPRSRIYVHPDEQIENLAAEKRGEKVKEVLEREWVLPTHLREKWSLRRFAECFDAVDENPPSEAVDQNLAVKVSTAKRRGGKRMLLATLSDDSTVVYYIVHDGIVKPRQN